LWDSYDRTITIQESLSPRNRWATLYHEFTHVALHDSGFANMLTDNQIETLCDAIATARMRERFG
jgi:Zn-dependent peptidase ImmA (M78 family)